jgi:O-antigen/teichoic acid export membrane protein
MSTTTLPGQQRGFKAPGTTFMVAGALIGALGAYVFQVYGTRNLEPEEFAPVSVLWTAMFILATVLLVPVEQYVTREVAHGRRALPDDIRPIGLMTVITALIGGLFVFVTAEELFFSDPIYILQMVLLMVGYALLMTAKGVLAGSRNFAGVGWVLIIETLARLLGGVVLLRLFAEAEMLGWGMVIGAFSVLGLGWWRHDGGESRTAAAPAGKFLGGYVGGTASSQVLLAGAPLAVAALGGSPALISVIFVTFTLYRAPLTLIFALQGRVLPYLVGLDRDKNHTHLAKIAKRVVIGGAVLAVSGWLVGWLVGANVVGVLYGTEYSPTQTVAAFAAAGVMAAAAAQIASQVLVAEGKTVRLSWAWLGGLMVGLVTLLVLPGDPDSRVAVAFAAGEFSALGLMALLAIRR